MKSFILAGILPLISASPLTRRQDDPCATVQQYTVAQGDTLSGIATDFSSTVDAIVYKNPSITDPDFIATGQTIDIPATTCNDVAPALPETEPATAICAADATSSTYTVASGDTLYIISKDMRILLSSLEAANPQIADPDVINVGDVINIPLCGTCVQSSTASTYTVISGDTLTKIAGELGITLDALEAANTQIEDFDVIDVGETINVPICSSTCYSSSYYSTDY